MGEYAARASARWQDGATLDVAQEMMRLTLFIVGKTLFDAEIESEAQEIGAALTTVMELFNTAGGPVVDLMEKLPLPSNRRFERARQRLDETIHRIIQEHRTVIAALAAKWRMRLVEDHPVGMHMTLERRG